MKKEPVAKIIMCICLAFHATLHSVTAIDNGRLVKEILRIAAVGSGEIDLCGMRDISFNKNFMTALMPAAQ